MSAPSDNNDFFFFNKKEQKNFFKNCLNEHEKNNGKDFHAIKCYFNIMRFCYSYLMYAFSATESNLI